MASKLFCKRCESTRDRLRHRGRHDHAHFKIRDELERVRAEANSYKTARSAADYVEDVKRNPIFVAPRGGRVYPMGRIAASFLADCEETGDQYSISEWWLEPHTQGPGPHKHDEDDAFYVLEGTMSFLLGDRWVDAPKGAFVMAPGGTIHDFQNRGDVRAGVLNLSVPGGFEGAMPGISEWFHKNPPGDA